MRSGPDSVPHPIVARHLRRGCASARRLLFCQARIAIRPLIRDNTWRTSTMFMSTIGRLNMRRRERTVMRYYDDGGPGRGNCTWGIGTMAHKGPCSKDELARKITDTDVERGFMTRLREAERGADRNVKVQLSQAQFDALVSLVYNAGVTGSSKVFALINSGDFDGAANQIAAMTYGHEVHKGKRVNVLYRGLVARRAEEAAPFRRAANEPLKSAAK
jgi:lysozyme